MFAGRDERSTAHDLTTSGAENKRLGGWGGVLVVLIVRYLGRRRICREGKQLPVQGSESLPETGTEKAIVAHFDKSSG